MSALSTGGVPVPPTTSLAGRRTDLTPCILFPELTERGGGLARAVLERANLYIQHFERVIILTTGFAPRAEEVVEALRARGSLDQRVAVRNFFQHSTWVSRLGTPPADSLDDGADGVASTLQRFKGAKAFRIADRRDGERYPFRYRYFDRQHRPILTTRSASGQKHELHIVLSNTRRRFPWSDILAEWVDEELEGLAGPVLFSLQRALNDPVLLSATKPVRKIASLHNCHYIDPEDRTSGIRGNFSQLLGRARDVDELVCLTEQQRGELEEDVPDARVRAIPYPGREDRSGPHVKDPELVVLVGQLIERKRVDHAIHAFRTVVDAVPRARLEVYGEGVEQDRLEALIAELGLGGSVRLMGYSLEVGAAQARASCALMTSTFEGYARVISEAMSRGTPVIAYDVRYGPRDLIRDGVDGVLVQQHEPEALARAIIGLLTDRRRLLALTRRTTEIVDRLPVERFEQAWLDVLTGEEPSVAAAPPAPSNPVSTGERRIGRVGAWFGRG